MEKQVVLYSVASLKNEDLRAPNMKKIPILLVFMCFAAHADWHLVHNDPTQASFFIDKDNLQVINGYRRAYGQRVQPALEHQPDSVTYGRTITARVAAAKAGLLRSF